VSETALIGVVDASVAVKWVNPREPAAAQAVCMRDDYKNGKLHLTAPAFWEYEIANGVRRAVYRGDLIADDGRAAIEELLGLGIELYPIPNARAAYRLSETYGRGLYDCFYLDLAERQSCEFWTADRKLYNAVEKHLPWVRWIEDYQPIPDVDEEPSQ
jgi:predicted nucleic acid-binding protein